MSIPFYWVKVMGMNQPNIWHSEYKSYIQIYDTIKNSNKKYISRQFGTYFQHTLRTKTLLKI